MELIGSGIDVVEIPRIRAAIERHCITRHAQPVKLKFSRATADFEQKDWTAAKAIDGNPATGWGIHPAVGQSHHAVFELAVPLEPKPGAKLTVSLKQLAPQSHLVGRFKLSATDEPDSTFADSNCDCVKCGTAATEGDSFCRRCGSPLSRSGL